MYVRQVFVRREREETVSPKLAGKEKRKAGLWT